MTYNHELFIRRALDGFLMQETTFPVEIILANDRSTDQTGSICETYAKQWSQIRYFKRDANLGSKENERLAIEAAKGKYLAFCEGDDYWIDSHKLQKQVDFLESHPDYSFCVTRFLREDIHGQRGELEYIKSFLSGSPLGRDVYKKDYLQHWITQYLTLLCRRDCYDNTLCLQFDRFIDTHQIYFLLRKGKGRLMNFISGVYCITGTGEYSADSRYMQWKKSYETYKDLAYKMNDCEIMKFCTNLLQDMLYWRIIPTHKERLQCILQIYKDTRNLDKLLTNLFRRLW